MTTMLEKAARGLWEEMRKPGDPLFDELGPLGEEGLLRLARAVLEAIREPSEALVQEGCYARARVPPDRPDTNGAAVARTFAAMIDAILNEKTP